jgi:hypothetical protein
VLDALTGLLGSACLHCSPHNVGIACKSHPRDHWHWPPGGCLRLAVVDEVEDAVESPAREKDTPAG